MTSLHVSTGGNLRLFRQLMIEAVLLAVQEQKKDLEIGTLSKAYDLAFGVPTRSNPFVA